MISVRQSDFLNLSRWLAAALVVVEHARCLVFQDYSEIEQPSLLTKGFYFATGFGHEAVVIFFVISGFLVGGKCSDCWSQNRLRWRRYIVDRVSRLYVVLVVALLLGGALDWLGSAFFDSFGLYSNRTSEHVAVVPASFIQRLTIKHFFCSFFMCQEVLLPPFGSNVPLWSLAHEWWYYLLFPMLLNVLRAPVGARLVSLGFIVLLGRFLTSYIIVLFGVWLIGVIAWKLNHREVAGKRISVILFGIALLGMRLELPLFPYAHQFLVGIAFALVLNSLHADARRLPFSIVSKVLADFSYSLYLLHFPIMVFFVAYTFSLLGNNTRLVLHGLSVTLWAVAVIQVFIVSFIVSRFTEARTDWFRSLLYKLLRVDSESTSIGPAVCRMSGRPSA